jgi:penicillin V acylase-like amidase (Ntn superfamily)
VRWTSRYGSLVTTVYGMGAIDGINDSLFTPLQVAF